MASARTGAPCVDQTPERPDDVESDDASSSLDDDDDAGRGDAAWGLPRALAGHGPKLRVAHVKSVARHTAYCSIIAEPTTPPPRA